MVRTVDGREVEAALVVVVPEAELLVGRFRAEYDPAAAWGVPAHITINYPFILGVKPTTHVMTRLSKLFAGMSSLSFVLDHIARFPNVLYLAPVPSAPLTQLIEQTAQEFPESPPYGGQFDSITPHLTVAYATDSDALTSVERKLSEVAEHHLPIKVYTDRVWLMDDSAGRWEMRASFPMGSRSSPP